MDSNREYELHMKEWEQRYETYRSFLARYTTSISIVFTIWMLGLAFTMGSNVPESEKPYLLGFLTLIMCMYFAVHLFARKEIRTLGDRIQELERTLGMKDYRTTRTLEVALWYVIVTICLTSLLTAFLTITSIVG